MYRTTTTTTTTASLHATGQCTVLVFRLEREVGLRERNSHAYRNYAIGMHPFGLHVIQRHGSRVQCPARKEGWPLLIDHAPLPGKYAFLQPLFRTYHLYSPYSLTPLIIVHPFLTSISNLIRTHSTPHHHLDKSPPPCSVKRTLSKQE